MSKNVDMREETIKVLPEDDYPYFITISIPADLFTISTLAAKEEFVEMWMEKHLANPYVDWEWKNAPFPC